MKISIFGTGYVGLVSGLGFASLGHQVICVDNDADKIALLKKGVPVIFEAGLSDSLKKNITAKRITFTTEADKAIKGSDIIFLALPTPTRQDGGADLSHLFNVARQIGNVLDEYKVVVNKSTAPVGTLKEIRNIIKERTSSPFDVVSNPEFLTEGTAFKDFLQPDRIVIGSESKRATEIMKKLYHPLVLNSHPILIMDIVSSELTKYASNGMLATRVSFMNQIANLCDALGANIESIRKGMIYDPRIGKKFLYPGLGYGGSCLSKDINALVHTARSLKVDTSVLQAVETANNQQTNIFIGHIENFFDRNIKDLRFTVWGLSFKPQTNDIRKAPALTLIKKLLQKGAHIKAHDPIAIKNSKEELPDQVEFTEDVYQAAEQADALIIATEWPEYRSPDFDLLGKKMARKVIFDGRNALNSEEVKTHGFDYVGVGKRS